jgi:hypothetical protein
VSSSGLIYAVIVGAWAAYLVPMWLRRQDELNDSRPTERFSTAIRLLSGRAAMERRYAKEQAARENCREPGLDGDETGDPDGPDDSADVRAFAHPASAVHRTAQSAPPAADHPERDRDRRTKRKARTKRAKVLARRRRTTMALFLSFTLGAVIAAVGGLRLLWVPAVPAILLSAYIGYLRAQERRRFAVRLDRQQAAAAARRLHERRRSAVITPEPEHIASPSEDRQALVEQTDHAEWVDQQRERDHAQRESDSWEPVPVPLPTYVNAPVAPRTAPGVDLTAPDAWSSARSTAADPTPQAPIPAPAPPQQPQQRQQRQQPTPRRGRQRGRTPLFDQYEDNDRPRAANK